MTVGNGGKLKGSTKLDNVTGHNWAMTKEYYVTFAVTVLGLRSGLQHGTRQTVRSLLNMLLDDFVTLTNLAAVYLLDEPTDKHALAHIMACFSLLMLGVDALSTPAIVERVWGQDNVVRQSLGGSRGDLAIIVSNSFRLPAWQTTPSTCGSTLPLERKTVSLQRP
jgi:hypothetical protein